MSKPMDKQAEERLLAAVKLVSASVEGGTPPNDAVVKVAQQMKLGRQMIPLVVHAYNVGRTTFQREHGGSSILDKQASFPIAHLETIVGQLYPQSPPTPAQTKAASAIDPAYGYAPVNMARDEIRHREKVASADVRMPVSERPGTAFDRQTTTIGETHSPEHAIKVAYAERQRAERSSSEAGRQYRATLDKYLAAMGAITNYFKEAAAFRLPFAEVEWNAIQMFGEPAKHALDYAYKRNSMQEKRASGPPSLLRIADRTQPPYSLIKAAIDLGGELLTAHRRRNAEKEAATEQVKVAFRPFVPKPNQGDPFTTPCSILADCPEVSSRKEANFLTNMIALGVGGRMRGAMEEDAKSKGDMIQDATLELSDPTHLQELRDIQTRAMLADFLNNDDVISGYDPEEVTTAFNEISKLSPRTANQPAVVRPLLRKRLAQGAMEPFEAQQVADIEKTVGQAQGGVGGAGQDGVRKISEVLSGNTLIR